MKLRTVFKWTSEWIKLMNLAQKRGRTWGCKHRRRFEWLAQKIRSIPEQKVLESLDRAARRRQR